MSGHREAGHNIFENFISVGDVTVKAGSGQPCTNEELVEDGGEGVGHVIFNVEAGGAQGSCLGRARCVSFASRVDSAAMPVVVFAEAVHYDIVPFFVCVLLDLFENAYVLRTEKGG